MATQALYANSHLAGDFANPNNAVGNTPGTWAGVLNENTSATSRWAMADPTVPLTSGFSHPVTVRCRKGSNSGNPSVTINLYLNGSLVRQIASATITSTTGQDVTGNITTAEITDANDVEIEVVVSSAGGNPNTRNSAQVAYILWSADVTPLVTNWQRTVTDDVRPTDTGGYTGTRPAESVGLTDSISYQVTQETGGQNYNRTITDTEALTDPRVRSTTAPRVLTDHEPLSDSSSRTVAGNRSTTDNVGLSDSIEAGLARVQEVAHSDPLIMADNVSKASGSSRNQTDQAGLTESIATEKSFQRSTVDSINLSDNASVARDIVVTFTDSVGVTDTVNGTLARELFRSINDNVALTDDVASASSIVRTQTDADVLSDDTSLSLAGSNEAVLTDSTGLFSSVVQSTDIVRSVTDSLALIDETTRQLSVQVSFVDSLILSDEITSRQDLFYTVSDDAGLTETFFVGVPVVRNITVSIGEPYARQLSVSAPYTLTTTVDGGTTRPAVVIGAPATRWHVSTAYTTEVIVTPAIHTPSVDVQPSETRWPISEPYI